jgi:hypothetical protein
MGIAKIYLDSPPPALGLPGATLAREPARHLMTFYSGSPYSFAARRLAVQASSTGWFMNIHVLHPDCPHPAMHAFLEKHREFVDRNPRGYGYWRWKPFLLQSILASLPGGDHLYYIDAGCEISPFGAARFAALDMELAHRNILCFEVDFPELGWSKREAVDAILGGWNDAAMGSRQIQATWFGLRNIAPVRELVAEWAAWAAQGELITDSLDRNNQHALFKGHRHDQSLLSLVLKKHGIQPLPQEDCYERWLYVRESWVLLAPVHGLRSRGRRSRVNRIVPRSSKPSCLKNLHAPSLPFRARLALSRIEESGVGVLSRLRFDLRAIASRIFSH